MNKRVLIITYYWPPLAGSGVQRWLKFSKYLPDFGWEPVIFTPENPDFELKDESLLKDVSPNLEVIKFPIWEPYHLFRSLKRGKNKNASSILENEKKSFFDQISINLRANLFVPDPRVFWVKPSVEFLVDCVKKGQFDAIISTGPPHSIHLIARNVKRITGIPWIADFRDPWSNWDFNLSLPMVSWVRNKHQKLEQSILKEANEIVTISPTFQKEFELLGNRNVQLITNGFDSLDVRNVSYIHTEKSNVFEILYTGVIDSLRDPIPFLKALKSVFSSNEKMVICRFVGKVSSQVLAYVQNDLWLKDHVRFEGYVAHEKVMDFYQNADLLLLILTSATNAKGNIPGKVFEYMASGKYSLALGDPAGDTANILSSANAGTVFYHTDLESIGNFLAQFNPNTNSPNKDEVEKYNRKALTSHLVELLEKVTS